MAAHAPPTEMEGSTSLLASAAMLLCAGCAAQLPWVDGRHLPTKEQIAAGYESQSCNCNAIRKRVHQLSRTPAPVGQAPTESLLGVIQNHIVEVKERFVGHREDMGTRTALALMEELENLVSKHCMGRLPVSPPTSAARVWSQVFPHNASAGDSYYFVKKRGSRDVVVAGFSMGKMWVNGVAYDPEEITEHEFLGPLTPDRFTN